MAKTQRISLRDTEDGINEAAWERAMREPIDLTEQDRRSAERLKGFIQSAHQANVAAGGLKASSEPQFCFYCSQLLEQFTHAPYCSSQCAVSAEED